MSDQKAIKDYLREAYSRVVIPDSQSGTFTSRILEFPGCIAQGNSATEALANLEEAAADWLTAALDQGQDIPSPFEEQTFSGRVLVRMPKTMHQRVAEQAEQDGVSLNQFMVSAIAEKLGYASAVKATVRALAKHVQTSLMAVQSAHTSTATVIAPFDITAGHKASEQSGGSWAALRATPSSGKLALRS